MAETVFTSKKIKEFSFNDVFASLAPRSAVFVQFSENFLVRYRPSDTRYWNCQYKKPSNLHNVLNLLSYLSKAKSKASLLCFLRIISRIISAAIRLKVMPFPPNPKA